MSKDELVLIRPPDESRAVRAPAQSWALDDVARAVESLVDAASA
jgi:hypothetical protein